MKVPESVWPEFKTRAVVMYHAPDRGSARDLTRSVVEDFEREHPTAVACFHDDFETCTAHQRMLINHHRSTRSTNPHVWPFVAECRQLKVIPNTFGERKVLKLMFGAMWRAAARWKPLQVLEFEARQLERIRAELSDEYEKSTGLHAASRWVALHARLSCRFGT